MFDFIIARPKFSIVLSLVIMIAGALSLMNAPVARFQSVSPPSIKVSTMFPGASAAVVQDTVATVIEEEVNGVEGMIYMRSSCGNDGAYLLTVTFEIGTDADKAQVQVQNRVCRMFKNVYVRLMAWKVS